MNETWGKEKLKQKTRKQSQNIGLITILNIKGENNLAKKQTISLSFRTYRDKRKVSSLEMTDQQRQNHLRTRLINFNVFYQQKWAMCIYLPTLQ